MAENLKYEAKEGAHLFDNDSNNISGYGVLYEWKTATAVCPKGWHLPSGAEFQALANHFEQNESWEKWHLTLPHLEFSWRNAGL